MRIKIILMIAMLVVAVTGLSAAHGYVDALQDDVTITQTVLHGDAQSAEGVSFTVGASSNYKLNWYTTYTVGAPEKTDTRFQFTPHKQLTGDDTGKGHVEVYAPMFFGIGSNTDIFSSESNSKAAYLEPARDVASRCEPGKEYTEIVNLNDYYDYIPLEMDIRLHNMSRSGFTEEMQSKVAEHFRIPVPEDLMVEVTVLKNQAGATINIHHNPADSGSDFYFFTTLYAITDENIYLLTTALEGEEESPDFSRFSEGYGIYGIPVISAEDSFDGVLPDVDNIHNVYPLPEDQVSVTAMKLSEDERQLLLFYRVENAYFMDVIALDGMKCLQTVRLLDKEDARLEYIWIENGLIIFTLHEDGQTTVMQKLENGLYEKVMEAEFCDCEEFFISLLQDTVKFDYRNGTLTAAALARPYDDSTLYLTQWTNDGLLYAGHYESSLNIANGVHDRRYEPRPIIWPPLTLEVP